MRYVRRLMDGLERLWSGKRRILPILAILSLLSGCATAGVVSGYRVTMPVLDAEPEMAECRYEGIPSTCVILLAPDFLSIVRELKAACLAFGASEDDCRIMQRPPDPPKPKPAT